MKNNSNSPKLPGEDDSWESLATNLFGIDFSKPAIPDEEDISFELSPKLELPPSKKPETEDVPPDEDVRLADAGEEAGFPEEEAGFPDEEAGFPEDDEEDVFDEPEAEFSVKLASGAVQEDPFAGFDEDEEEEELVADDIADDMAEEEDDEAEEEEADTYWEALNDFEWDSDEEQSPSRSAKPPRRGSAHSGPPRAREREQRPDRKPERKPERKHEVKKASVEERAIVDEEIASAADYINEYDDSDFGLGLIEEASRPPKARVDEDEIAIDEEVAAEDFQEADAEADDEQSPDRKRRRRRRRRKPRGDSSERETPAASKTAEEFISEDEMDFESFSDEEEKPAVKEPRGRARRDEEREEDRPRRKRSRRRQKPESEPVLDSDPFSSGLSDEEADEPAEEERRPRRRRTREEASETEEVKSRTETQPKDRSSADDKDSPYRNIPTWEEAISYLIQPKRGSSGSSRPERDSSDSSRPSGRKRRRRP